MNRYFYRYISPFFICCFFATATLSFAQPGRITETEVNTQKVFIDANREKILGNYENAAYLYKEVLKRDKDNHAAAYELARIYDVLDQNDKALKSINLAIELDGENTWYRMFLGDVLEKAGKYDEAADVFKQLVKNDPQTDYYYMKWAFYLIKEGKADKAIKVYDELEKKVGLTEELVYKKQTLYIGLGDTKKAASELQRLVDAFPSNMDYRHELAEFYLQAGEDEKAKDVYNSILAIDAEDAKAIIALANKDEISSGEEVGYLYSLRAIYEKPDVEIDLKIRQLIPYIHKIAETNDEELSGVALELTKTLAQVHPKEAKAWSAYGDVLFYSGRKEEALEKYLQALQFDKTIFTIWEQVMYLQAETGDFTALNNTTTEAMDIFPNKAKTYYFNGIANSQLGKSSAAISVFQQAMVMSRNDPPMLLDLHKRIGIEYAQLKKYDRSDKSFEEALKIKADDVSTLHNYSLQLAHRNDRLDKALELAKQANDLEPENPKLQYAYGYVFYKKQDYKSAQKWLEKALGSGGANSPDILEHYGDVLFQLGKTEEAIQYWQQALEKGSTSQILEKKITTRQLY